MIRRPRREEDITPLTFDCGLLCGSRCCKGGKDAGMRLFPGETPDGSFTVQKTPDGGRLLLCGGHCDRKVRPLSCRIFPLFPYLGEDGRIRAGFDPRAFAVCPLVRTRFTPSLPFIRQVRRIGRRLAADPDGRRFLAGQTAELRLLGDMIPRWEPYPRLRLHTNPKRRSSR